MRKAQSLAFSLSAEMKAAKKGKKGKKRAKKGRFQQQVAGETFHSFGRHNKQPKPVFVVAVVGQKQAEFELEKPQELMQLKPAFPSTFPFPLQNQTTIQLEKRKVEVEVEVGSERVETER